MRRRIDIAASLVVVPEIVFLDEPTTGLDPVTSEEISILIMEVQKKYKTSSIIITHDLNCARHTANRIAMLDEGKVHKESTLKEFENSNDESSQRGLLANSRHPWEQVSCTSDSPSRSNE